MTVAPDVTRIPGAPRQVPPTTAECRKKSGPYDGIYCYQPSQLRTAYHLNTLYAKGITGKGETIVIVDPFGSPTIKSDLATEEYVLKHYKVGVISQSFSATEESRLPPPGHAQKSGGTDGPYRGSRYPRS